MILSTSSESLRSNILEIDLNAAASNMQAVRNLIGPERNIFAVVKADGYGYGAVEMGSTFIENGANALAVADLFEGIRLRKYGINVPILVYPNSLPTFAKEIISHKLLPVLVDLGSAKAYSNAATAPFEVFVKIDVGYERLGIPAEEAPDFIANMLNLPNLQLAGICSHGHAQGANPDYAEWQLKRFTSAVEKVETLGIKVPIKLLAASPFVLRFPQTYLNAVDPGRMLYGITYPGEIPPIPLKPVLKSLTTYLISVKEVNPRNNFAEFAPFHVLDHMKVGVIPIGISDGLPWLQSSKVLVRGHKVSVIPRESLEYTLIDLTEVIDAKIWDEVKIIGFQGNIEISATDISLQHKIKHLAVTIGPRFTRRYIKALSGC